MSSFESSPRTHEFLTAIATILRDWDQARIEQFMQANESQPAFIPLFSAAVQLSHATATIERSRLQVECAAINVQNARDNLRVAEGRLEEARLGHDATREVVRRTFEIGRAHV